MLPKPVLTLLDRLESDQRQSRYEAFTTVDAQPQRLTVARLARRFRECGAEKNSTMVRHDILTVVKRIYDSSGDESLRSQALRLIELEPDAKYRRKYAAVWTDRRARRDRTRP